MQIICTSKMCFRQKGLVKSFCGAQKLLLCCKVIFLAVFFFFLKQVLNGGIHLLKTHPGTIVIFFCIFSGIDLSQEMLQTVMQSEKISKSERIESGK